MDRFGFNAGRDVPVHQRSTVSYGRGWLLLRSRGAARNFSGACDPPQPARACECTWGRYSPRQALWEDERALRLPFCDATVACGERAAGAADAADATDANAAEAPSSWWPPLPLPPASRPSATIAFALDFNRSQVRFYYKHRPFEAFIANLRLAARLVLSLRSVRTSLPITFIASGERIPAYEQWLTAQGVSVVGVVSGVSGIGGVSGAGGADNVGGVSGVSVGVGADPIAAPAWASPWATGSFAKLHGLLVRGFDTVILLDHDTVALQNLDHLSLAPAPAFAFGFKCVPRLEMRTAVAVLRPRTDEAKRLRRTLDAVAANASAMVPYDDEGVQAVWAAHYARVSELPVAYAALRSSDLSVHEWRKVALLHDPNLLRGAARPGFRAEVEARVKALDREAERQLAPLEERLVAEERERERQPERAAAAGARRRRDRRRPPQRRRALAA